MPLKLYIAKIGYKGFVDNLFFEGPDSPEGEKSYQDILEWLRTSTPDIQTWVDFRAAAMQKFQENGFSRVVK